MSIRPGAPRIGHDLVEISRLAKLIERRPERYRERVFCEGEWAMAESRPDKMAVLAARFAAKEAAFKVLGTGWGQGLSWQDVEVVGGGRQPPSLTLHGEALRVASRLRLRLEVSISHTDTLASAVVLGVPQDE